MKFMRESKCKITETESRKQARELMRNRYPEISWHIHCVHHKDGNPFNNKTSNLQIINRRKHSIKHGTNCQIKKCIVENCKGKKPFSLGFCLFHYQRFKRKKSLTSPKYSHNEM